MYLACGEMKVASFEASSQSNTEMRVFRAYRRQSENILNLNSHQALAPSR